jgi:HSP20 family molecular chaperone IbpA
MKVDESNYLKDHYQKLVKEQRNKALKQEKEIKRIDQFYEKEKEAKRASGEEEVFDIDLRNNEMISKKHKEYEDKLNNYKNHLTDTKVELDKQKKAIVGFNQQEILDLKEVHDEKYQEEYDKAVKNSKLAQEYFVNRRDEVSDETDTAINDLEANSLKRVNTLSYQNENKIKGAKSDFERREKNEGDLHRRLMVQNKAQHEREMLALKKKNFSNLSFVKDQHLNSLKKEKSQANQRKIQEEENFNRKYSAMITNHQNILNRIESQFQSDMHNITKSNESEKKRVQEKLDDDFYRVSSVDVNVEEDEKSYFLSMKIPEYERDLVSLSGDERTLRLTLGRRFKDEYTDEEGRTNMSKRSEVFSQTIPVKQIIDANKIIQTYNDETLTFKVAKK